MKPMETMTQTVDFFSKKKLDINVTHVLVETFLNMLVNWNKLQEVRFTIRL